MARRVGENGREGAVSGQLLLLRYEEIEHDRVEMQIKQRTKQSVLGNATMITVLWAALMVCASQQRQHRVLRGSEYIRCLAEVE